MRYFHILVLGLVLTGLAAPGFAANVGSPAPDFRMDQSWNLPPGKTRLSDFRGSVVLLETWATW
jgi:hypothetical protein